MSEEFKNIKEFVIYSNYNGELRLTGKSAFTHVLFYQSLLDDSVRASFRLLDTGYRDKGGERNTSLDEPDDINLTTGEKVKLTIADNNGAEIKTQLAIENVKYSSSDTMSEMVNVNLCSDDYIKMQFNSSAPSKHFEGKIHEIVRKVLTDHLKTEQDIHVHSTLNRLPINGSITDNPLDFCTSLAPKSIPEDYPSSSGFFFYNTVEGYHFKSIDKLLTQEPKRKMVYNSTTRIPEGFTNKILNVSFNHNMNITNIMQSSSLTKSKLETFDNYTNQYTQNEFDSNDTYGDTNTGKEKPKVGTHLKVEEEQTKVINQLFNTGVLPPGSSLEKQLEFAKEPTLDINAIIRKSIARYNQAFLYRAEIVIYGDFEIYPGDMIHCTFPEVSAKLSKSVSKKKTGKYLVCDVSHLISAEHCYTRLNIVRDSIL